MNKRANFQNVESLTNKEIAIKLGCSVKTVLNYKPEELKRIVSVKCYDWDNYTFTNKTAKQISEETGCTIAAAMYQLKKRGIYKPKYRKK